MKKEYPQFLEKLQDFIKEMSIKESQEIENPNNLCTTSNTMLQKIINAIPTRIFWKNTNSVYYGCNTAFAKDMGLNSIKDIIGKTDYDFFLSKNLADSYKKRDQKVILSNTAEYNIIEKQNKKDNKELWIRTNRIPLYNYKKEIIGILGTYEDITNEIQLQKAIDKSEKKYKEIVQNANSIILRMDPTGKVIFFNEFAEKIFGYKEKEILNKNIIGTIVPGKDTKGYNLQKMILEISQNIDKYKINENENITKNGTIKYISWANKPIFDNNGKLKEILCIGTDLTEKKYAEQEKKKLEQQLHQAQKMEVVGTLAGGIAHDFNNSLAIIFGYSDILLRQVPKDNKIYSYVKHIMNAAKHSKELVNQILLFSRRTKQEKTTLKVDILIKESLKLFSSSFPSNIKIVEQINSKCPPILASATQIRQIFANLCTNAGHAMEKKGGTLEIKLDTITINSNTNKPHPKLENKEYLCLTIKDTGHGIEPKILDHIFEPIFTTKKIGKGTGLGLSVVHGIVSNHNGIITVDSKINVGTTFNVYIPVVQNSNLTKNNEKNNNPIQGKEHIVFVDDNENIVSMSKLMLEDIGYKVSTSTTATNAINYFKENHENIDIAIIDYTMPEMFGTDLAKEIKNINPNTPIIITTGFSKNIDESNYKKFRIQGYINKPITSSALSKKIQEVLKENKV